MMDFTNLGIGISLVLMGIVIIFVGNYYSKIIGIVTSTDLVTQLAK
jgi:hypothetical protein